MTKEIELIQELIQTQKMQAQRIDKLEAQVQKWQEYEKELEAFFDEYEKMKKASEKNNRRNNIIHLNDRDKP